MEGGTRGSWFTTPSLSFGDFDFPPDFFSERKVDFVACDMPSANAFMINVYAAVAQEERRMISDRTKAGLAAVKARGVKLGGPRTARNQQNATGGRPGASTGHCADSLGVGWNVGPLRGCGVERAPGRDTKRRAVVCQDRHPGARAVGQSRRG